MTILTDKTIALDELKFTQVDKIPYLHNMQLFALMRALENIYNTDRKIGDENRLNQTIFKFGQSAHLAFQSKQINIIKKTDKYLKVDIKGFGLFGSNGPLPLHLTEYVYEKRVHHKDTTLNDFVDIFHHRLISLFYKAWRNAQSIISLDGKSDTWQFSRYIGSSIGIADQQECQPDVSHYSKMYYSGYLLNKHMPVSHLKEILSKYFNVPVSIDENVGQWVDASEFSTVLSSQGSLPLGQGLLIGDKIFDATQKFRINVGPLSPEVYLKFLPNKSLSKKLIHWVEQFSRYQYQWDVKLIVDRDQIDQQTLGQNTIALGYTSWLGQPKKDPNVILQY